MYFLLQYISPFFLFPFRKAGMAFLKNFDAGKSNICLNLFTSGLWGFPSALLTLRYILSQQAG